MQTTKLLAVTAGAALVLGCEYATAVRFPAAARRISPPAIYREWWFLTEACSGRKASFDEVAWYVMPNASELGTGPHAPLGKWFANGNRILLADSVQSWGDIVRHEMLHAILGSSAGAHPREFFIQRCGGAVACDEKCEADGGPAPAPPVGATVVPASAIEVGVHVTPAAPSSSVFGGYFMMTVSAHNAAAHPVIVDMPVGNRGEGFGYTIVDPGLIQYDLPMDFPEEEWFAPGETKEFVFDFRNVRGPNRYYLEPGTYRFKGEYAGHWAESQPTVRVGP